MEDEDFEMRVEYGESEEFRKIYEYIYEKIYIEEEGLPKESLYRFIDGANGIKVKIIYIIAYSVRTNEIVGGVRIKDFGGTFIKGEKGAVFKKFRGLKAMIVLAKACLAYSQKVRKPIFFWVFSKSAAAAYEKYSDVVSSTDPIEITHENGKKMQLYFAFHPLNPKPKPKI